MELRVRWMVVAMLFWSLSLAPGMAPAAAASLADLSERTRAALITVRNADASEAVPAASRGIGDVAAALEAARNVFSGLSTPSRDQLNSVRTIARLAIEAARSGTELGRRAGDADLIGQAVETGEAAFSLLGIAWGVANEMEAPDAAARLMEDFREGGALLRDAAPRARAGANGALAERVRSAIDVLVPSLEAGAESGYRMARADHVVSAISGLASSAKALPHLADAARASQDSDLAQRVADTGARIDRALKRLAGLAKEAEATSSSPKIVNAQAGILSRIADARSLLAESASSLREAGATVSEMDSEEEPAGIRPEDVLGEPPLVDTVPASPI